MLHSSTLYPAGECRLGRRSGDLACPAGRNTNRPGDIWLDLNYTRIYGVGGKSWPKMINDAENDARYAAASMHLCLSEDGLTNGGQPKEINDGKIGRPYEYADSLF